MGTSWIREMCYSSPEFKEFYESVKRGGVDTETLTTILNKYLDEHLQTIINNIMGGSLQQIVNNYLETHEISALPTVTTDDNGKMLQVVDGVWQVVDIGNVEDGEY